MTKPTSTSHAALSLLARILLASIFLVSAATNLQSYAAAVEYMAGLGVPAAALPVVLALQMGCGLCILGGIFTRTAAGVLAVLALVTAAVFHRHITVDNNLVDFMKNIAIAGGLVMLVANGPGRYSIREGKQSRLKNSGPQQSAPPKLVAGTADALTRHRAQQHRR